MFKIDRRDLPNRVNTSWLIVAFDTDVKIARAIFIRGGEDSS
jgi:hypothetical protein